MTTREYHFRLLVIDDDRILLLYPKSSEELHGRRAKAALEFLRSDLVPKPSEPANRNYNMTETMKMLLAEVVTNNGPVTAKMIAENLQIKLGTASSRLSMLKSMGYLDFVTRGKYLATINGRLWLKEQEI